MFYKHKFIRDMDVFDLFHGKGTVRNVAGTHIHVLFDDPQGGFMEVVYRPNGTIRGLYRSQREIDEDDDDWNSADRFRTLFYTEPEVSGSRVPPFQPTLHPGDKITFVHRGDTYSATVEIETETHLYLTRILNQKHDSNCSDKGDSMWAKAILQDVKRLCTEDIKF